MLKKRLLCCRAEISTNNNNNNTNKREENGGVSNSSAGRRVHHDTRDGSFADGWSRGGRGRGRGGSRGRGRGNSGGTDIVAGNAVKSRSSIRTSSETRLPPDSVQPQRHDGGNDTTPTSTQQYHHQNSDLPPASLQGANRSQDETTREYSQHSNSKYNA